MNKATIVTYYNNEKNKIRRTGSPAAVNVVNYVSEILNGLGYDVEIISPSWFIDAGNKGFIIKDDEILRENCRLVKTPSIPRKGKLFNTANKVISRLWILKQLCFSVSYSDPVFIYHEPTLIFPVKIASRIRKMKVIMITEELYSDIPKFRNLNKAKEVSYLVQIPNAYIFPTDLLNRKINTAHKDHVIIHGTYHVETDLRTEKSDDKIHAVYAGTFAPTKGGTAAVDAAEYLTEKYHVHIIGFGSQRETEDIVRRIEDVKRKAKCEITYDGLKTGKEYLQYIQNCDIGLSVQNPDASYNETSFPSKVLSYLSNGLRVVSIRIKALETSSVNDLLYYYDEQSPQKIAETIMSIDMNDLYDSRKTISELNASAICGMKKMIEDLQNDKAAD